MGDMQQLQDTGCKMKKRTDTGLCIPTTAFMLSSSPARTTTPENERE